MRFLFKWILSITWKDSKIGWKLHKDYDKESRGRDSLSWSDADWGENVAVSRSGNELTFWNRGWMPRAIWGEISQQMFLVAYGKWKVQIVMQNWGGHHDNKRRTAALEVGIGRLIWNKFAYTSASIEGLTWAIKLVFTNRDNSQELATTGATGGERRR